MATPIRILYPGAVYHVMARGSHGQEIFQDDRDWQRFRETVGETCEDRFPDSRLRIDGQPLLAPGHGGAALLRVGDMNTMNPDRDRSGCDNRRHADGGMHAPPEMSVAGRANLEGFCS